MTGNASGPFRLNMNSWARGGSRNHAAIINVPFVTRTVGISQGGLTTRRYSSATARRNPGTASMNTSWRSARRRRGPRHLFRLESPALSEGPVSHDLRAWQVPCLIFMGAADNDFLEQARRGSQGHPDGGVPRAR